MGWQPIETAPKDRFIIVYCPEDDSRWWVKWQSGEWCGVDELGLTRTAGGPDYVTGWKVTHWQDIPTSPPVPEEWPTIPGQSKRYAGDTVIRREDGLVDNIPMDKATHVVISRGEDSLTVVRIPK